MIKCWIIGVGAALVSFVVLAVYFSVREKREGRK